MSESNFPIYPGWETVRKIGAGSYGAVYEIERDVLGKKEHAALKVLSVPRDMSEIEELAANGYDRSSITKHFDTLLSDIVQEYQFMADMKGSSNVVDCDDIRYTRKPSGVGWDIYIRMELLSPLTRELSETISEEQVIKVGKDICHALMLCENRNIIHRDIKPQNIFVSRDGEYKLGDFGIAKTIERTSGGTKAGTLNYMAPEVNRNEPYGHAADIYSLGIMLYWMLNERCLPFLSLPPEVPTITEKENALIRRFRGDIIPAPVNGSPALQRIVLKACAYHPVDRYHTARELYTDLLQYERPSADLLPDPEASTAVEEKVDTSAKTIKQRSIVPSPVRTIVIIAAAMLFAAGAGVLLLRESSLLQTPQAITATATTSEAITATTPTQQEASPAQNEEAEPAQAQADTSAQISSTQQADASLPTGTAATTEATATPALTSAAGEAASFGKTEDLSEQQADQLEEPAIVLLTEAETGDTVLFGSYEQDGILTNGREPIEWLVLAKEEDRLLLISRYALDSQNFADNGANGGITWENSSLRTWLNESFFNEAFNSNELKKIQPTTVTADNNPEYSSYAGSATWDQVFLLSSLEADHLFDSRNIRACSATPYAVSHGAYSNEQTGNCFWWLRTTGSTTNYAAVVNTNGDINNYGIYTAYGEAGGVRPAIWLNRSL